MKLRKRWLILITALLLLVGAGVWLAWHIRTPEYRAARFVAEFNWRGPGPIMRLLIKVGLADDGFRPTDEVLADLTALGPPAVPYILQAYTLQRLAEGFDYSGYPFSTALADIGPDIIPKLIDGTRSADEDVRNMCIDALGLLGPEAAPAAGRLAEIVLDEQEDEYVRAAAAQALGDIGPVHPEVVAALVRALDDNCCPRLREYAAVAVGQIGPPAKAAVPLLISALQYVPPPNPYGWGTTPSRMTAIEALAAIGPDAIEAEPVLREIVQGNIGGFREEAQEALEKITPRAQRP